MSGQKKEEVVRPPLETPGISENFPKSVLVDPSYSGRREVSVRGAQE